MQKVKPPVATSYCRREFPDVSPRTFAENRSATYQRRDAQHPLQIGRASLDLQPGRQVAKEPERLGEDANWLSVGEVSLG
jgi:hypothetical protein